MRVERDEDIELIRHTETVYAQIKTRKEKLAPSDIEGVLARFDAIRSEHASGRRTGTGRFAIVANVELGASLAQHRWPTDVLVLTPGSSPDPLLSTGLHLPKATIEDLLRTAVELAESYRLSALRPESLVSKLIGIFSAASANVGTDSSFATEELDRFCELVASQVRPLPVVQRYRPQLQEPTITNTREPTVIAGGAGDGKSAWAAHVAANSSDTAVYLPCDPDPGAQIAPRFVDIAIATLASRGDVRAHELVRPGRTGLDALAILDAEVAARGIQLLGIVDDCHHLESTVIVATVRAAPNIRWILLGRPSSAMSLAAATLGVPRHALGGWDDDTIASLLAEVGCSSSPTHVAELRRVTGGSPLFTLHAVRAITQSGLDTGAYARSLIEGTTGTRPAQELLLENVVSNLSHDVARVASMLATAELSLSPAEWAKEISNALHIAEGVTLRAIREVVEIGIALTTEGTLVYLHDAFRPLLVDRFASSIETTKFKESLVNHLRARIIRERAGERIVTLIRILSSLGRLSELADVANATSEWIRETGTISVVRGHLETALARQAFSDEDSFWALDTLIFFDVEEKKIEDARKRLTKLRELAGRAGQAASHALIQKEAMVAWSLKDIGALQKIVASCPPGHSYSRAVRYYGALGEASRSVPEAVRALMGLADEYLADLGLTKGMVAGKSPSAITKLMKPGASIVDAQHLADCYDAITRIARDEPGYHGVVATTAIWAMKFFEIARSPRSVLRAGQEVVDSLLEVSNNPFVARDFMEKSLLPAAHRLRLPEMTVPIRAQYAVVCALCGDFAAADAEMGRLGVYIHGLPADGQAEIANQAQFIEQLRLQAAPPLVTDLTQDRPIQKSKIARNSPCPCGSGKKYKKCCGKSAK